MTTRFQPGDTVHLSGLGTGVLREVRNGGRALVVIKGRPLLVDESQLAAVDARSRANRKRPPAPEPASGSIPETLARSDTPGVIDLHGMTTDEAVTALDVFLSNAILGGLDKVRVIHGRSGGRVKAAVHRRIRSLPSVRGFHVDPGNQGVTIVEL